MARTIKDKDLNDYINAKKNKKEKMYAEKPKKERAKINISMPKIPNVEKVKIPDISIPKPFDKEKVTKPVANINEEKLKKAKEFKEQFFSSKTFDDMKNLFIENSHGLKNNEDNANRYINMENIINAFTNDVDAQKELNEIKNTDSAKRMFDIVKNHLDGKTTYPQVEQYLFAELHGIDTYKLPDIKYTNKAIVNLSVLAELCPGAVDNIPEFAKNTEQELKTLTKAALNGRDLGDVSIISELSATKAIEDTKKDKQMREVPISINGFNFAKTLCYDYDFKNDNVDIFEINGNNDDTKKIASIDKDNNFILGSMNEVTSVLSQSSIIRNVNKELNNDLQKEINEKIVETRDEAMQNPMSMEEKQVYNKEQEEAFDTLVAAGNPFLKRQ